MEGIAESLIKKGGWRTPVACAVCVLISYLIIWKYIEPADLPKDFLLNDDGKVITFWLQVFLSVVIGLISVIVILAKLLKHYRSSYHLTHPEGTIYEPANSVKFYDRIATKYDDRNSASLQNAHHKVIEELVDARNIKKKKNSASESVVGFYGASGKFRVLDIGGGTGKLVATHFSHINSIEWHYLDESPSMLKQFVDNMKRLEVPNRPGMVINTFLKDIEDYLENCKKDQTLKNSYDAVIINFSLTSMKNNPNWERISDLLSPGGRLIVADIDASYTARFPYYSVIADNEHVHLKPRAVPLSVVMHEVSRLLKWKSTFPIKQNIMNYAYVTVFEKRSST